VTLSGTIANFPARSRPTSSGIVVSAAGGRFSAAGGTLALSKPDHQQDHRAIGAAALTNVDNTPFSGAGSLGGGFDDPDQPKPPGVINASAVQGADHRHGRPPRSSTPA